MGHFLPVTFPWRATTSRKWWGGNHRTQIITTTSLISAEPVTNAAPYVSQCIQGLVLGWPSCARRCSWDATLFTHGSNGSMNNSRAAECTASIWLSSLLTQATVTQCE